MKKLMLTGIFLLLGIFAISAQNLPSITIVNNTGYSIYNLYVSPTVSDEWGEEILGDAILENGQSFSYQLPQPLSEISMYDIAVEDEDLDVYFKWRITIINNARIVFTLDDIEAEYDG